MQSNIEVKARLDDWERVEAIAAALSDTPCKILYQEDTFFRTPQGRLKLRQFCDREANALPSSPSELIYYERPDQGETKQSHYWIYQTAAPNDLLQLLASALDKRIVVKKTRHLYVVKQTRIHLDRVEGLGEFLELEVVLEPGQEPAEGDRIAKALMLQLGIVLEQLIAGAYADLLEEFNLSSSA